jgi:ribosome-associated translation inhibitor RaiA
MQLAAQITFHGMKHSAALAQAIGKRTDKLARLHPQLTSCRAVLEHAARSKQQGKEFVVRLDLKAPGADIAINRDHSEDPFVAVRSAFDAARRKLNALARRKSGAAKRRAADGLA